MISQILPDGPWSRMIKTIKNFIYSTIATNGSISSKRVVTISTLMVWLGLIIFSVVSGKPLDSMVFYGMMGVILGGSGITTYENISQSKIKAQTNMLAGTADTTADGSINKQ